MKHQTINYVDRLFLTLKQPLYFLFASAMTLRFLTFGIPPLFDTTESRYANMVQHFLLRNDWLVPYSPTFHLPFLGKPPFVFWLEGMSLLCFKDAEWALRFPSFVGMLVALISTYYLGRHLYNKSVGFLAVLILLSCGFFNFMGSTVALDMWVAASVSLSFLALSHLLDMRQEAKASPPSESASVAWHFVLMAGLVIGFMTKGLLPFVMIFAPVLVWLLLTQRLFLLKRVAWHWIALGVLCVVSPWLIAVQARHPDFLHYFFIQEHFLRYVSSDYGDRYGGPHIQPYGTSLWYFLLAFLPASLLLVVEAPQWIKHTFGRLQEKSILSNIFHQMRQDPVRTFLWTATLFPPLFFAVAKSLLVTYIITALAPASLLMAVFLSQKMNVLKAQRLGLALATIITLSIALWNWTWLFPSFTQNPLFGQMLYPDYRSARTLMQQMYTQNPTLLTLPIYAWQRHAPFSWMFYLQEPEVEKAKTLWWQGQSYTPTPISQQEPNMIQTIQELKQIQTPFLLYTQEKDKDSFEHLSKEWPSHLKKHDLFKQKKGGTLSLITSSKYEAL